MAKTPSPVARARWKLAHALWPARLRPHKLLTQWRRRACEAEAVLRWERAGAGSGSRPRPEARSQNGEDALLWDLLGDVEAGFFVEAGAYDGYTFSVSYLFECAGWDGLLIEPLADKAAACAARRTGSRVVAAALAGPDSPSRMSLLRDEVEWNSRLSGDGDGELVDVTTLDTLLEGHEGAIDFAVLDLEGHELEALRGFDLARWQPTAILVEDNTGKDAALREHLEANGYVHIASLTPNELFLRREERHRAERLAPYWGDLGLS